MGKGDLIALGSRLWADVARGHQERTGHALVAFQRADYDSRHPDLEPVMHIVYRCCDGR